MRNIAILLLCAIYVAAHAQNRKEFTLTSPNGRLSTRIVVGEQLTYDITLDGRQLLLPSPVGMTLDNGQTWGENARLTGTDRRSVDETVPSPFYRSTELRDHYNELTLRFKKDWGVEFRAYDEGIAYRFVHKEKKPFNIVEETVDYRFPDDAACTVSYVKNGADGDFHAQFDNSSENLYVTERLSKLNKRRLIYLPLIVDTGEGVKLCITEADLENYPGLYLLASENGHSLRGKHAPYPKKKVQGGHNNLQMLVKEREDYIAQVDRPRNFAWRTTIVATEDKEIAANSLTYLLAAPSRVKDTSWIKPGKVAWEWWNNWNLDGVDFKTGVNNATYKAYIDFAAAKGIEYVILDEGWAVNKKADLMQVVKEIDLKELIGYAAERHVDIILWAGYYAFDRDMERICRHYSQMGVKGFKVDFMNRDDQEMTAFNYRAAAMCAKYKLILDLHGTHKPAGLNRTYPNTLNFEAVHGLEQMKFRGSVNTDQVTYDVMVPYLRQVSGPVDYTQGAMRNVARSNFYPCNSEPMSQGTRCRQLALYMVFDSPLNMLCDSPSNYMREPESTDFIAGIPTVWDETLVLDGKLGEYIVTARRKGDTWYVGGITDWKAREIELNLSFLNGKEHCATLFKDGVNADRVGRDYKRESFSVRQGGKLKIRMAPGGGFALKIE